MFPLASPDLYEIQPVKRVDFLIFRGEIGSEAFRVAICCFLIARVLRNCLLSYDPYGPARAFIAKLLRKSPYEGRTRWREQGRKKPSGPARIAYGPHTGILSIARARCELKQLCCYVNPDFSVKMSDVSEYSDSEFYYPKKSKNKKKRKSAVLI